MLLAFPAVDTAYANDTKLEAQRATYIEARNALRKRQTKRYQRLLAQLGDYPLKPYLEYRYLVVRRGGSHDDQIEAFIRNHSDSHLARRLQHAWLHSLFRRHQYTRLISTYQEQDNVSLQCLYVRSHIRLKRSTAPLQPLLHTIWLFGKSRPRICDPLLKWFQKNGLNKELVWQRIELSMAKSNTRMARYLKRFLPEQEQHLVDLWIQVHRRPQRHLQDRRLRSRSRIPQTIVSHGVTRLSRRQPEAAYRWYQKFRKGKYFNPQQKEQLRHRIAISAASDGLPLGRDLMADVSRYMRGTTYRHMRLRLALHESDWGRVLDAAHDLPDQYPYNRMAIYWQGRALEALGQRNKSAELFRQVAQHRGYYGFLAAERVGLPHAMNHAPVPEESLARNPDPAVLRAREFHHHGDLLNARKEWSDLLERSDPLQLNLAGVLASDWHWHEGTIRAFGRSRYYDDLDRRFPTPYAPLFAQQAHTNDVDPALLQAIARRESTFAADTRSPAGAIGLMQLMPPTARQVSRALKLKRPRTSDLKNPDLNIRLGSRYLADMLKRYHGNPAMALAAYNAGPGAVDRWLPEVETDADIWIDTIPFKETRRYVRTVLEYRAIYQWHTRGSSARVWPAIQPIPPK